MKILLLSLNSDPVSHKPSRYGGAGITKRRLSDNINDCYLAAENSCFEGDITERCIPLSERIIKGIRDGLSLDGVLRDRVPGLEFDVVVYADPGLVLYTQKPQIVWAVGANETVHPEIKHLLTHNLKWQQPQITNPATKIHEFVLGIDIPAFQVYEKEDFLFSCGNQYPQVNSHVLASWAVKNKIKVIFAGPIDPTYREQFLQSTDYNLATYVGQIDEVEKIKLMTKAISYVDLVSHPINGPRLSVKMALSYGCSIITTTMGIMPEVIKNGVNGFIIQNENDFVNAWGLRNTVSQLECFNSSLAWSLDKMVSSFQKVVGEVINGG